jgi:Divergent InlB B-repeat domain
LKLLTLYIIAAAVTIGGSGVIILYANTHTQTYTVTAQVQGGNGVILGAPYVDLSYDQAYGLILKVSGGDGLKLMVVPDPGYKFSSWGGDLKGSVNPITVVVSKDLHITAILVKG